MDNENKDNSQAQTEVDVERSLNEARAKKVSIGNKRFANEAEFNAWVEQVDRFMQRAGNEYHRQ